MDIWSGRRKLLAKTFMDIAKIIVAAAFASQFFVEYSGSIRIVICSTLLLMVCVGIFTHPKGDN